MLANFSKARRTQKCGHYNLTQKVVSRISRRNGAVAYFIIPVFNDRTKLQRSKERIFRTEPRRGGKKIAQGATLGTGRKRTQALKGRDNYYVLSGLGASGARSQGCTLGYHIPLRWSLIQKIIFLNL